MAVLRDNDWPFACFMISVVLAVAGGFALESHQRHELEIQQRQIDHELRLRGIAPVTTEES